MRTSCVGLMLLILSNVVAGSEADSNVYPSFEIRSHDGKSPTFVFSEGYATSKSPIVITTPGRKLTNAERQHRVDLQKHWLSRNVPKHLELQSRTLDECGLKRPDEIAACDHYVFVDAKSKQTIHYYIYVGNWP